MKDQNLKENLNFNKGDGMKGNLLLVDDEPLILKGLKFNLEDYADTIYTAENGVEAIDQINKHEIHCIICDINMPKMNGVEVIKEVRKKKNNVPFIFYTAHGNHDLMLEVVKYGAFDFLNKPDMEGLEDVVQRGLAQGTAKEVAITDEAATLSEYQKLLKELNDS